MSSMTYVPFEAHISQEPKYIFESLKLKKKTLAKSESI